jgi:penicillin-binding protein 1A
MREDRRRRLLRLGGVSASAGAALALSVLLAIPAMRPLASAVDLGRPVSSRFKPLSTRSIVYARDGAVLAVLHADEDRELVQRLDQVPKSLIDAVIDTEDRRFYQHNGVDMSSVARAMIINAQEGSLSQGGSTITQQLVKNEILTSRRDVGRKMKEAALAIRLEGELSKNEILKRYLNTIYFGEGAYGVRTAAERFFGKNSVGELTPPESALLAGLIRDPSGYNPFVHPDSARARRSYVLRQMVAMKHLDPKDAERYDVEPLPTAPQQVQPEVKDYFVEEVKRRLLQDVRVGSTYQQRYHQLFRGGLRIHTTLDSRMQEAAKNAVESNLPESPFTAALVAMDPENGEVRALVGGPNFEKAKFNLATQGARQPGSSFKTITLAAALAAGKSPNDSVDATAPCSFKKPGWLEPWTVNNYESGEGGVVSLTDAIVHSLNCAFANVVLDIGPQKVVDMAHELGVRADRKLQPYPSITLGAQEVTPLEMATVMSTFAADGVRHDPVFVTKVQTPGGHTLLENHADGKRAVEAEVVRTETSMLRQVITRGTGTKAAIGRPAAGKTGTAENWHDAWFCGYTPQLATAVWMGHPAGQIPMYNVGGVRVVGGTYPAQIWSSFMKKALEGVPVKDFPAPDTSKWGSNFIGEMATTTTLPPEIDPLTGLPVGTLPTVPTVPGLPGSPPYYGQPGQPGQPGTPRSAAQREQDDNAGY